MTPNPVESSFNVESVSDISKVGMPSAPVEVSRTRYLLQITQACLGFIGYVLIGLLVGINLQFAYRFGPNLTVLNRHIVLSVLGFQLLMGAGILALTSESGYAVNMSLKHKRWLHTLLLIAGSVLALWGCFIMSLSKTVNFNTYHGITALVAMVCTVICFFNGFASLFAREWRRFLPATFSKLTHIFFGICAFAFACVSLCYGFEKSSFRNWATEEFVVVLYVFTGILTAIVILNPFITFFGKLSRACSN